MNSFQTHSLQKFIGSKFSSVISTYFIKFNSGGSINDWNSLERFFFRYYILNICEFKVFLVTNDVMEVIPVITMYLLKETIQNENSLFLQD